MGSGTITLRVLKPDPMPVADRDGQPYRETDTRTSRDAGPYLRAVCARSEATGLPLLKCQLARFSADISPLPTCPLARVPADFIDSKFRCDL